MAHVSALDLTPQMLAQGQLLAAEASRLERLRDPSHGRALTAGEIHALLAEAGAGVTAVPRP